MTRNAYAGGHRAALALLERVEPNILSGLPELVESLGGDPVELLARAGIDAEAFLEGRCAVSYTQMLEAVALAAAQLHCPDFGMRLASRQVRAIRSPLMDILHNSRSLGEAWELVTSHSYAHSLSAAIWLRRAASGETVMLGHDILLEGPCDKRQAIEQILLVIHLSCCEATGGALRARRVEFRHQPLSPLAVYRRYFGCDVRFGQPADGIVYGKDAPACLITSPDPTARSLAIENLDVAFPRQEPPLHVTIRGLVTHWLGSERCTNAGVAETLSLHPRTMHRRLKAEGTSFQRVKNEVRRDLLVAYLEQTDYPFSEISERLAFAEQSAMTRFCQRSFGVSPTERRAMARRQDSSRNH